MIAAAVVFLLAAAVIYGPGVVGAVRRSDARLQALIDDALDPRDLGGNVAAFDRMGKTR